MTSAFPAISVLFIRDLPQPDAASAAAKPTSAAAAEGVDGTATNGAGGGQWMGSPCLVGGFTNNPTRSPNDSKVDAHNQVNFRFMEDMTIVIGVYRLTENWGAPLCRMLGNIGTILEIC